MLTINHNNTQITLTQEAYLAGTNERPICQANAADADGNEYQVNWAVNKDYMDQGGELDSACDWDNPTSIIKI